LKLGREECFQRVLTSLILDAPYPRWNSRSTPSSKGLRFLKQLYIRSFDGSWPGDDLLFVDELELQPRHDAEKGGAPDWAVMWRDHIWLIELKTERSSHRADQVPYYFDLAHHHFADRQVLLTYLTGPMSLQTFRPESPDRYAHLQWHGIADLIGEVWADTDGPAVPQLLGSIGDLGLTPSAWRVSVTRVAPEPPEVSAARSDGLEQGVEIDRRDAVAEGKQLAAATRDDELQRAISVPASNLEELQSWRLELRVWLAGSPEGDALRRVMPWIWRAESSGGRAATEAGEASGYELRLSRYRSPLY
jgi:hypothetical protein